MKKYILENVPKTDLVALYLGGRILTNDRVPTSDIEIFGIVNENFDVNIEEEINEHFENFPDVCGKREGKFHALFLSDFEGKTQKNPDETKTKLWIKLFPFFTHLSGKEIDWKNLEVKALSDIEELTLNLTYVKKGIAYAKRHYATWGKKMKYRFQAFVKHVLHCAQVEVSLKDGKRIYEFLELVKHLGPDRSHIAHKCIKLRNMGERAEQKDTQ